MWPRECVPSQTGSKQVWWSPEMLLLRDSPTQAVKTQEKLLCHVQINALKCMLQVLEWSQSCSLKNVVHFQETPSSLVQWMQYILLLLLFYMNIVVVMLVGSFCLLGFSTLKGAAFHWKPQKFVIVCFAMKTVTFTVAVIVIFWWGRILSHSFLFSLFFSVVHTLSCLYHTHHPTPATIFWWRVECVFVCVEGFSCDERCVS